uniref:Hypotheticial protein n=1 Tax=Schistosoma japonicum TaxID=6182 RepID=C1LEW1_SCHJA|nr:hypotheticial protein [Schistosoma japonicum]
MGCYFKYFQVEELEVRIPEVFHLNRIPITILSKHGSIPCILH